MASESLASGGTAVRRRSRLWRDLARDYQLHLIIALPVIWFIVFKYLPRYGAQIAFRDFAAAKGIWGSPWVGLDRGRVTRQPATDSRGAFESGSPNCAATRLR